MLIAHLEHPKTYQGLLEQPPWQTALNWLRQETSSKKNGDFEIDGHKIYASVQSFTTLPRNEGVFEAHQEYIDLHLCLTGEEIIEWSPVNTLKPKTEYDADKDFALYEAPMTAVAAHYTPGIFGIYLPADAHMPKIAVDDPAPVKKVVIKIKASLIEK